MTAIKLDHVVVLSGRDCAVLWRAANLNELRIKARGQDDDLYRTLVTVYENALVYRDSVSGKAERPPAESAGDWLWWNTQELAARAGCTPRTIRNHIRSGYIQADLRGREWVISVEEGQKYLQSHRLG
jgi:hypothetical protein